MDLADYRTRISFATGLSIQNGSDEQALIDSYVNEAVLLFLVETKCHIKSFDMTTTAGEGDYDLDADILAMKELWYEGASSGQSYPMQPVSMSEIVRRRVYADGASGAIPTVYAIEGQNFMAIDPIPTSSSDKVHGLYVPRPTPMTEGTHSPSTATYGLIPEEFHHVLQSYAMGKVTADDDKFVGKGPQEHMQDWENGLIRAKIRLNKKAGVLLAPAVPGRRRGLVPRTPGTDTGY